MTQVAPSTPPASGSRGSVAKWALLAGTMVAAGGILAVLSGGDNGPSGPRRGTDLVAAAVLADEDVAGALAVAAGEVRAVSPPIDVDEAERMVRRLPFDAVPLPDQRAVSTWRAGPDREVTQAVLYYSDPASADKVVGAAASLLPRFVGLEQTPAQMAGVADARTWSGTDYEAVSFRQGPFLVFVGLTGGTPADAAALAAAAAQRVPELPAATATEAAAAGG